METQENLDRISQKACQCVSEIINKHFGHLFSRQASYRYYEDKKYSKDRYFYTTEKIDHKGKLRYVAGIYRYLKSKKQFKLVKKVGFSKKKRAIQWANDAYNKTIAQK